MQPITAIHLHNDSGDTKTIRFDKDGRVNQPQKDYFNALFFPDLTLRPDYEELSYFGGFRCAKSFTQQTSVHLICSKYPGVRVLYVRNTYDQLIRSVIQQYNEEFENFGDYEYMKTDRVAKYANGSIIYFRAFNYDTDILSAEYDVICACQVEDIQEELFLQFFGGLSGNRIPRPLLLTEGNPSANYVKTRYKDAPAEFHKENKIFFIEGQTADNPYISKDYIDRVIRNYPAFWVKRYIYGGWDNIDEMVYSEFKEHRDIIEPVSYDKIKHFIIKAGFDYGWKTPSAMIWACVDYSGNITIYSEWGGIEKTPEELEEGGKRYGRVPMVTDYSIKKPDRDGKSLWTILSRSLNLVAANKDELTNIVLVNTLLKQGRLKVTRNCVELIKEMRTWKWKAVKLGQDKSHSQQTIDKDNHYCDALNYLINNIESKTTPDPAREQFKKTLVYANISSNKRKERERLS